MPRDYVRRMSETNSTGEYYAESHFVWAVTSDNIVHVSRIFVAYETVSRVETHMGAFMCSYGLLMLTVRALTVWMSLRVVEKMVMNSEDVYTKSICLKSETNPSLFGFSPRSMRVPHSAFRIVVKRDSVYSG